ncbi:MAG: hypothetical protein IT340_08175 [Chloroflexi bacterium]|nr:hypothetical protein [Chloroflexota bacterium]
MASMSGRMRCLMVLLALLVGPGAGGGLAGRAPVSQDVARRARPVVASRAPVWTTTGSLPAARSSHTATLLLDGRVLVAGGAEDEARADVYVPATGAWSAVERLRQGRLAHTATLLHDGTVLVVGGLTEQGSSGDRIRHVPDTELFDPAMLTWAPVPGPPLARHAHTATLLADGTVLVVGGLAHGRRLTAAERYDPVAGVWLPAGAVTPARFGHTATTLADGAALVTGGAGPTSRLTGALLVR